MSLKSFFFKSKSSLYNSSCFPYLSKSTITCKSKSEGNAESLKKLKDKLKDYRQSGLDKDGEFSYENLVFKYLRRSGHIGKLFDEKTKIKDKELSIETKIEENHK